MNWYWASAGSFSEGRVWLNRALCMSGSAKSRALIKVVWGAGVKALVQGDIAAARPLLQKSLDAARGAGDDEMAARALNGLGLAAHFQGDSSLATSLFEHGLASARRGKDKWSAITILHNMGYGASSRGDHGTGRRLLEESLAGARELADRRQIASRLTFLGRVAREQGDPVRARSLNHAALATAKELGTPDILADALYHLGLLALDQCDLADARSLQGESLKLRWECGALWHLGSSLDSIAAVDASADEVERAAWLWGAAQAWRDARSMVLQPVDRADYDRAVGAARESLGGERFEAAWALGAVERLSQVVATALEACSPERA